MPYILQWYNSANELFNWKQDIIWCKRGAPLSGNLQVLRTHENIFVFVKGSASYIEYTAKYEDITLPLVEDGLYNIESVFRQLSYFRGLANGRILKNIADKSTVNDAYFQEKGLMQNKSQTLGIDDCRLPSVWSFLPHNRKYRNKDSGQVKHPTVKSIDLMERLVRLLTPENGITLDCFVGTGTTAIAAKRTNRRYLCCELDKDYFDLSVKRVSEAKQEISLF